MSWFSSASEWKQGLSTTALSKIDELENQNEKLKKERLQRQNQLDTLQQSLDKQKRKIEEEVKHKQYAEKELEQLARNYDHLQTKLHKSNDSSVASSVGDSFSLDSSVEKTLRKKVSELEKTNKELQEKMLDNSKKEDPFWSHFSSSSRDSALPQKSPFKAPVKTAIETSEENPFRAPITPHKKGLEISEENPFRTPRKYGSLNSLAPPTAVAPPTFSGAEISELEKKLEVANKRVEELLNEKSNLMNASNSQDNENMASIKYLLEKSKSDCAAFEKELLSTKDELAMFKTKSQDLEFKVEKLEARVKNLQTDSDCFRQNAESVKMSAEEKLKNKDTEFLAETSRLQTEIGTLEQQIAHLTTRSQQQETLARNEQNLLQAALDKANALLSSAEKEKMASIHSCSQAKMELERLQKMEEDQKKSLSAFKQDKDMMMAQIETLKFKLTEAETKAKRVDAQHVASEQLCLSLKCEIEVLRVSHKADLDKEIESHKLALDQIANEKSLNDKNMSKMEDEVKVTKEKMVEMEKEKEEALKELKEVQDSCYEKLGGVRELESKISQLEGELSEGCRVLEVKETEWKETLERTKTDLDKEIKSLQRSLEEVISQNEVQVNELRAVFDEEKERITSLHQEQVNALDEKLSQSKTNEEKSKEEKLTVELRVWELEGKVDKLSAEESSLLKKNKDLESHIKSLQRSLEEVISQNEVQVNELRAVFDEEKERITSLHQEQVNALDEKLSQSKTNEEKSKEEKLTVELRVWELEGKVNKLSAGESSLLKKNKDLESHSVELQSTVSELRTKLDTKISECSVLGENLQKASDTIAALVKTLEECKEKLLKKEKTLKQSSAGLSQLKEDLENAYEKLSQESALSQQRMDEWTTREKEVCDLRFALEQSQETQTHLDIRLMDSQASVEELEAQLKKETNSRDELQLEFDLSKVKMRLKEEELQNLETSSQRKEDRLVQCENEMNSMKTELETSITLLMGKVDQTEKEVSEWSGRYASVVEENQRLVATIQQMKADLAFAVNDRQSVALDFESYKEVAELLRYETATCFEDSDGRRDDEIMRIRDLESTVGRLSKKVLELQRSNSLLYERINNSEANLVSTHVSKAVDASEHKNKHQSDDCMGPEASELKDDLKSDDSMGQKESELKDDPKTGSLGYEDVISDESVGVQSLEFSRDCTALTEELRVVKEGVEVEKQRCLTLQKENDNLRNECKQLMFKLNSEEKERQALALDFESYKDIMCLMKMETEVQDVEMVPEVNDHVSETNELQKNIANLSQKVVQLQKRNSDLLNKQNSKSTSLESKQCQTETQIASKENELDSLQEAREIQTDSLQESREIQTDSHTDSETVDSSAQANLSLNDLIESERAPEPMEDVVDLNSNELERLKKEVDEKENEVIEMGDRMQDLMSDMEKLQKQNEELKVRLMNGTLSDSTFVDANSSLNESSTLDSVRDELNQAKMELQRAKEQRDHNMNMAQDLEERVESLHKEIGSKITLEKNLKKELEELKTRNEDLSRANERLPEDGSGADSSLIDVSTEKQDLKERERDELMQELIVANDRLEIRCKNLHDNNEELTSLREVMEAKLEASVTQTVFYEREIETLRDRLNEFEMAEDNTEKQRVEDLQKELLLMVEYKEKVEEQNRVLETKIENLADELKSMEALSCNVEDSVTVKLETEVNVLRDLLKQKTNDLEKAEMSLESVMEDTEKKMKEHEEDLIGRFALRAEEFEICKAQVLEENMNLKNKVETLELTQSQLESEKLEFIANQKSLTAEMDFAKSDSERLGEQMKEMKTDGSRLRALIDRAVEEKHALEIENEDLREKLSSSIGENELSILNQQLVSIETEFSQLKDQYQELKDKEARKSEETENLKEKLSSSIEEIEKLSTLNQQLVSIETEFSQLKDQYEELKHKEVKMTEENENLKEKLSSSIEEIEKLSTLNQQLVSIETEFGQLKHQYEELKDKEEKMSEENEILKEKLSSSIEENEKLSTLNQQLVSLETEFSQSKDQCKELKDNEIKMSQETEDLKEKLRSSIEENEKFSTLNQQLVAIETEFSQLKDQYTELKDKEEKMNEENEDLKKTVKSKNELLSKLENDLANMEHQVQDLEVIREEKVAELERALSKNKEIEELWEEILSKNVIITDKVSALEKSNILCIEQVNNLKKEKDSVIEENSHLNVLKMELLNKNQELQEEKEKALSEIEALKNSSSKKQKQFEELSSKCHELETQSIETNKRLQELESEMKGKEDKYKENESASQQELLDACNKFDEVQQKLITAEESIKELESENENLLVQKEKSSQELSQVSLENVTFKEQILEKEKEYSDLNFKIEDLQLTIQQYESQLADLRNESDLKGQQLSTIKSETGKVEEDLKEKQAEVDRYLEEISTLKHQNSTLSEEVQQKEKLNDKIAEQETKLTESKEQIKSAEEAVANLKAKFVLNHSMIQKKEKELNQSHNLIQKLKDEVKKMKANVKEALSEAKLRSSEAIAAEKKLDEWKQMVEDKEMEIDVLKGDIKILNETVAESKSKYENVRAKLDKVQVQNKTLQQKTSSKPTRSKRGETVVPTTFSESSDVIPSSILPVDDLLSNLNKTSTRDRKPRVSRGRKSISRKSISTSKMEPIPEVKQDASVESISTSKIVPISEVKQHSVESISTSKMEPISEVKQDSVESISTSKIAPISEVKQDSAVASFEVKSVDTVQLQVASPVKRRVTRSALNSTLKRSSGSIDSGSATKKLRMGNWEGLPHKVQKGFNDLPLGHEREGVVTRPTTPLKKKVEQLEEIQPRSPLRSLDLNFESSTRSSVSSLEPSESSSTLTADSNKTTASKSSLSRNLRTSRTRLAKAQDREECRQQ